MQKIATYQHSLVTLHLSRRCMKQAGRTISQLCIPCIRRDQTKDGYQKLLISHKDSSGKKKRVL